MHEFTIGHEVVRIVESSVDRAELGRVRTINLDIGALTGVHNDCLQFAIEVITEKTPMEGVSLRITKVEPLLECRKCGKLFVPETGLDWGCPGCGTYGPRVLRGNELSVRSVDLE